MDPNQPYDYEAWCAELSRRATPGEPPTTAELMALYSVRGLTIIDDAMAMATVLPTADLQKEFADALARNCARMRGDLSPPAANQIDFDAVCAVCREQHRFRVTITPLAASITLPAPSPSDGERRDWFIAEERQAEIDRVNAEHEKNRKETP